MLKGKTEGVVDEDFITHTISVEVDPKHILGDRCVGGVSGLMEGLGSSRVGLLLGNGRLFHLRVLDHPTSPNPLLQQGEGFIDVVIT